MKWTHGEVINHRLATQRVTTTAFEDPVDVVRWLLCVQAQDAPLARYSLGLRTAVGTNTSNDSMVRAALDAGRVVRTHVLRPTWHFVAAEDLRWLLALTSKKVESSLASRHRQLDVDERTIDRSHREIVAMLEGGQFMTVPEICERFGHVGLPERGAVVRHLLLVAELRGLVCSGPMRGMVHTYGLVDELIAPSQPLARDDAIRNLVHRFFAGRGPASQQDLRRWTTLTLTEIRGALAELDDVLESITFDETAMWFDPSSIAPRQPLRRVALLPAFDPAYLPYKSINMARVAGHPRGDEPHVFAEAGGGVVVVDGCDAGWWKRTEQADGSMIVRLALASSLDDEQRQMLEVEAAGLAAFFGRVAIIVFVDP